MVNSLIKKNKKGFTIIELLVIALIIGILASVVAAYLTSSRNTARDSRISIGITQIESVAEIIYSLEGEYNSLCSSNVSLSDERGLNIIQEDVIENGGTVSCFAEGNSYCISAKLNNNKYFCVKNDRTGGVSTEGCTSATVGCEEGIIGEEEEEEEEEDGCLNVEGTATQISSGFLYSLALKDDGTVYAWGYNNTGQLGDNTVISKNIPTQVKGVGGSGYLTGITKISAGYTHSLTLKTDGTVWAWGTNVYGQLGDGSTIQRNTPVQVKGVGGSGYLTNVQEISAGHNHSLALKADGTVYAWGWNYYGQLGDGTMANKTTPVQVKGVGGSGYLTGITKISAGDNFSLALKNDGTVYAWGVNLFATLGDGSIIQKTTPVQVKGVGGSGYLTEIIEISAGYHHSLALKSDGTVYTWGFNADGELGDGTIVNKSTPVQVKGVEGTGYLTGITKISAGAHHSLTLKSDDIVYSWGRNYNGELGDGTVVSSLTPVRVCDLVEGESPVVDEGSATKVSNGSNYTLALKTDGTVYAWGSNGGGQLGDNTTNQRLTPVKVLGYQGEGYLTDIEDIKAGFVSLALKNDGTIWAWGNNGLGSLGDGTLIARYTPIQVKGVGGTGYLTDVSGIASGLSYHSLALKTDGTVYAWGKNDRGQLGDGTTTNKTTPIQVKGVGGVGYLTDIKEISKGLYHSVALKTDGTVYAWGANSSGELGNGENTDESTPVQVYGLSGITSISAGGDFSLALKSDGTVWGWGVNSNSGQLGDGTTVYSRNTPVQVRGLNGNGYLSNIISISAGVEHSLALKTDGTVYAWGTNFIYQLGDGTNESRYFPIQVKGDYGVGFLSNVSEISAGNHSSFGLKSDGTVWGWGYNYYGQIGDNTVTRKMFPVKTWDLE